MDKVRFAIIGLGMIGRQHCRRVANHPGVQLVEVVDVDEERARQVGEEYNCRFSSDALEACSKPDVDAVLVAVPHYAHPEIAIAAAEEGKHVFCEKPIAVTVGEGDKIVAAAKRTGVTFGVDYQMRATEPMKRLRDIIQSGSLGEVHRVFMLSASLRPMSYFRMGAWRGTWQGEGGGVTLNQGTHALDLFQWVFGLPVEIQAWADTHMHDISVEDFASAMLRYDNGAHGYVHCSTCEFPDTVRFEVFADKGHAIYDGTKLRIGKFDISLRDHIDEEKTWRPKGIEWEELDLGKVGWGNHDGIFDDFVQAVLNNRQPLASAEDALRSLELTNAIILSGKKRKAVRFPIDRREYDHLLQELIRDEQSRLKK